jgi:hypothetical protein
MVWLSSEPSEISVCNWNCSIMNSMICHFFRRRLPLLPDLCSADLFGFRFSVPCEPVDYLNTEYGKETWKHPLERNYTWLNMKYDAFWNDISWMYAVRLYTREGRLRNDQYAINWISNHFNYSITAIPSFINAIPDTPVTLPPIKSKLVYSVTRRKKQMQPRPVRHT